MRISLLFGFIQVKVDSWEYWIRLWNKYCISLKGNGENKPVFKIWEIHFYSKDCRSLNSYDHFQLYKYIPNIQTIQDHWKSNVAHNVKSQGKIDPSRQ